MKSLQRKKMVKKYKTRLVLYTHKFIEKEIEDVMEEKGPFSELS